MKPRVFVKIVIDCFMTGLLLALTASQLIGEVAHEWIGAGMFVLFITHHILNWKWLKNLSKGRYTAFRIFQTAIVFLLFVTMVGLMFSAIVLSRYVFDFLPIQSGRAFARTLHHLSAYWAFVLMSLHLGLHWGMIIAIVRKAVNLSPSRIRNLILRISALLIAAYGMYAFLKHEIGSYLFMLNPYSFFDFDQPLILFFADYMAIMCLFAFIAYYIVKLMQVQSMKKRGNID